MKIKAGKWLSMTAMEKIVLLLETARENGYDVTKRSSK